MHLLPVHLLFGLAASAAVSVPRDASPEVVVTPAFTSLDTRTPPHAYSESLSKRLTYTFPVGSGEDYYCGEVAGVIETFGPDAPLAADCLAIRNRYPDTVRGYWTITVADQNSAAPAGGWITLAKQGTCAFKVRLEDGQTARDFRVGTNDVWFYTGYARGSQGSPARYQGISDVGCNWQRVITTVRWGIVRP